MEDQAVRKGVLITLEGGEGCGKTTQIGMLYRRLRARGESVFLTREPGGTKVGDKIREILLDKKNDKLTPLSETLLYMASRAQLVSEVIEPKLRQGAVVLCDRWVDATIAYQGFAGGVDVEWIRLLSKQATRSIEPRLSLYLDLPVRAGLRRALKRQKADRLEAKNISFHEKVRKGYLWLAKTEPNRFRRLELDENDTISCVHDKILTEVDRVLARR